MSKKAMTSTTVDTSVLSKRNMDEIAGDAGSREWTEPSDRTRELKAAWLADAIARVEKKKKAAAATKKSLHRRGREGRRENKKGKNGAGSSAPPSRSQTFPQPAAKEVL